MIDLLNKPLTGREIHCFFPSASFQMLMNVGLLSRPVEEIWCALTRMVAISVYHEQIPFIDRHIWILTLTHILHHLQPQLLLPIIQLLHELQSFADLVTKWAKATSVWVSSKMSYRSLHNIYFLFFILMDGCVIIIIWNICPAIFIIVPVLSQFIHILSIYQGKKEIKSWQIEDMIIKNIEIRKLTVTNWHKYTAYIKIFLWNLMAII